MKLINVLSILFFFAVTSCSMEDSMMSDTEKEMPVASDNQMVLSFTLNGGITTKATGVTENPTTDEAAINNCIIFLLDNKDGNVIGVTETTNYDQDITDKRVKILTKVRRTFAALAIVNASDADRASFKVCATRSDIDRVLVNGSLNNGATTTGTAPSALLKTGVKEVTISEGFVGTPSTAPTDANTITVEIPVKQRTARIELSTFSVVFKDENGKESNLNPMINSVMLSNQAISTYAFSEPTEVKESWYGSETKTLNHVFYAYQNTKESKLNNESAYTTMTIKYTYTTQSKKEVTATKEFPIITSGLAEKNLNGNKVIAGCSYKIRVNIEITSVDVEANVQYEVLPFTSVDVTVPDFN